jgi:phosphotriesterase-related protein
MPSMDSQLVNTARDAIKLGDLGVTLMHEHVFIMTTEITQNYPEHRGNEAEAVTSINELIFSVKGGY